MTIALDLDLTSRKSDSFSSHPRSLAQGTSQGARGAGLASKCDYVGGQFLGFSDCVSSFSLLNHLVVTWSKNGHGTPKEPLFLQPFNRELDSPTSDKSLA